MSLGFNTLERNKLFAVERAWFSYETKFKTDMVRYMRVPHEVKGTSVVDPFRTVLSDLRESNEEILSKATKTVKYEVNKCLKENVEVVHFSGEDVTDSLLKEFEDAYTTFAVGLNNKELLNAYSRGKVDVLRRNGNLLVSKAFVEGINVYHIYAWGGEFSCLLYSVSNFRDDSSLRNLAGRMNKMHHMKDMSWLRDHGVLTYDWGNISRSGKQAGIDQFKVSFGGVIVDQYNILQGRTLKGKLLVWAYKLRRKNLKDLLARAFSHYWMKWRSLLGKFLPAKGTVLMLHNVVSGNGCGGGQPFDLQVVRFVNLVDRLEFKNVVRLEDWQKQKDYFYALTFDDVAESFYLNAYPILKKNGLPFTLFVNLSLIGKPGYINKEQLNVLASDPLCTIGSHGVHHEYYRDLDDSQIKSELHDSKAYLEE